MEASLTKQNGNGQYAPTSLEAWNQHTTQIIELTEHLSVEIQSVDFLALLTAGEGTNPLLAMLQGIVDADEQGKPQLDAENINMGDLLKDPEKLKGLSSGLDKLLIDIVVSPRLKEQGHEDGVPLMRFKMEWKMQIFEAISGGNVQLEAAQRFLKEAGGSLVVAQPGEGVRTEAE